MNKVKKNMVTRARNRFGSISPYAKKNSLNDCFEFFENNLLFWFNSDDGRTHLMLEKKSIHKTNKKVSEIEGVSE